MFTPIFITLSNGYKPKAIARHAYILAITCLGELKLPNGLVVPHLSLPKVMPQTTNPALAIGNDPYATGAEWSARANHCRARENGGGVNHFTAGTRAPCAGNQVPPRGRDFCVRQPPRNRRFDRTING
ncbi:hypothetical protein [Rhodanobacter lindaniclasticus]